MKTIDELLALVVSERASDLQLKVGSPAALRIDGALLPVDEQVLTAIPSFEELMLLHEDKKSIIEQREVGLDTESYATALKYVLRQDPDVILIGEMRDLETVGTALTAVQTGHLVLSTNRSRCASCWPRRSAGSSLSGSCSAPTEPAGPRPWRS